MINRFFFLFLASIFLLGNISQSIASGSFTPHTQHTPIELKPVSLDGSYKTAAICFLGVGDCDPDAGFKKGGEEYDLDSANRCSQEGFKTATQLKCSSVQKIDGSCPYNSNYGKKCVCADNLVSCPAGSSGVGESCGGKYLSCGCAEGLITCPSNKTGSGASCDGKYEACVCKSEYKYTSSNCANPRSLGGASCDGKYTTCTCPSGISAGTYGCEEYYPAPCSSVCKIANSDNCHNRTAVQTPYGCIKYWDDCPAKCEKAYTDNCRNRTAVTCQFGCVSYFADCQSKCQSCNNDNCANRTAVATPYGCQTYWADCSTKCQTAYADNCHKRTAAATPYGCQTYWADCSAKCQTAYADNCHKRTAVSIPANATCSGYFDDCPTKCAEWSCNSGYEKSGNSCVKVCDSSYNKTCLFPQVGVGEPCNGKYQSCVTPCTSCEGYEKLTTPHPLCLAGQLIDYCTNCDGDKYYKCLGSGLVPGDGLPGGNTGDNSGNTGNGNTSGNGGGSGGGSGDRPCSGVFGGCLTYCECLKNNGMLGGQDQIMTFTGNEEMVGNDVPDCKCD